MIEWFRRKRPRGETPPQIAASGRFVELRRKNEPSVEIPNPNDIEGAVILVVPQSHFQTPQ